MSCLLQQKDINSKGLSPQDMNFDTKMSLSYIDIKFSVADALKAATRLTQVRQSHLFNQVYMSFSSKASGESRIFRLER